MEGKGEPKTEEDLPGAAPMADVVTEKNQRLIEADAREAAKNAFPHVKIAPTSEYGDGLVQCRELLLK
eukprot:3485199-Alexandrium_andersonii.AAC.1